MSENETPNSGSRWEPGATPEPTAPQPIPAQSWVPPQPAHADAAPATPGRGRLALAAAAVGLVAAGGVGGFVVGQASAGNADETDVVPNGVPGAGEFPGGRFPGGGARPDVDGDGGRGTPPGADDGTADDGTGTDASTDGTS